MGRPKPSQIHHKLAICNVCVIMCVASCLTTLYIIRAICDVHTLAIFRGKRKFRELAKWFTEQRFIDHVHALRVFWQCSISPAFVPLPGFVCVCVCRSRNKYRYVRTCQRARCERAQWIQITAIVQRQSVCSARAYAQVYVHYLCMCARGALKHAYTHIHTHRKGSYIQKGHHIPPQAHYVQLSRA